MVIKLRIHGKVDIDVPEWRDLAAQQDDDEIQPESFRDSCDDTAVAMEDRNDFDGDWRKVFVTVGQETRG